MGTGTGGSGTGTGGSGGIARAATRGSSLAGLNALNPQAMQRGQRMNGPHELQVIGGNA